MEAGTLTTCKQQLGKYVFLFRDSHFPLKTFTLTPQNSPEFIVLKRTQGPSLHTIFKDE